MSNIAYILARDSFKKELKEAIESGKETDWRWNGEDEYPVQTYNEDWALKQVIDILQKHLTSHLIMKTLEEIQKEIANERGEEHFEVLVRSELEVGDIETATNLLMEASNRYILQFI